MSKIFVIFISVIIVVPSCNSNSATKGQSSIATSDSTTMDTTTHEFTNELIHETSPYLLQHAHNPVNWYPWGKEALKKAQEENKPLLISIGYSACHWCHVMEHESFEDEEVARIMNENFVCIKVDREERPDVDQIYMDAVQLMTERGGWPLNCFATPDGKPFFGGTYFPKNQWINVLEKVNEEYRTNKDKVEEFAQRLTEGVKTTGIIPMNQTPPDFTIDIVDKTVKTWSNRFDNIKGGPGHAPKFPLPNNYQFLLRYWNINQDEKLFDHIKLTLYQMAYGGIYDQLGGGFARYSTDVNWKVPHFEKMLYDNAQLVSLYAEAYQATKDPLYKDIVYETLQFVEDELTGPKGVFYSALDADSEGEEGKYYVWKKEELQELLGSEFDLFAKYYNVNHRGLWEHGNYILLRDQDDDEIAKKEGLSVERLKKEIDQSKKLLLAERSKRIKPGLDDKSLTSWNALMLKGYADAYLVFNEPKFLDAALKNAAFITQTQRREDGGLYHSFKEGKSTINGYLEDYCFAVEALLRLYEVTFDEQWLISARELTDYALMHFLDDNSGMFYFTSDKDEALVARKFELNDNVIPASNSSMAKGLFLLGHYYDNKHYRKTASQMLNNIKPYVERYGSGYSNWLMLMLHHIEPFHEIAISGKDANEKRKELSEHYLPGKLFVGSTEESNLPLLENKFVQGETMIYVCLYKTCKLTVSKSEEALKQLQH